MHLMSRIQLVSYETAEVKLGLPAESELQISFPAHYHFYLFFCISRVEQKWQMWHRKAAPSSV